MKEKKPDPQRTPSSSFSVSEKTNGGVPPKTYAFFQAQEYKIPTLPLLDDMVEILKTHGSLPDLSRTVFIGVQHILETTVTLFDALIALGVKPENMFFSGKCYSTSPVIAEQVVKRGIKLMPSNKPKHPGHYEEACQHGIEKMWKVCIEEISHKEIDRIIILDEGGRCLENMPEFVGLRYRIAAIEQTRGGLYTQSVNLLPFPLVEVATSAVKKILEPPLIAEAIIKVVLKKIDDLLPTLNAESNKTVFGLIGNGAIGSAICNHLLSHNFDVVVYDENESSFQNIINPRFFRMGSIEEVVANAQIIFGCTGKDITQGKDLVDIVKKDKIFISCTSEDKEFRTLLRATSSKSSVHLDALSNITCMTNNGRHITILQGGFPINFDRQPWNVPASSIEVTQGLLLGSCYQAILSATKPINDGATINHGSRQSLHPLIQRFVATHWLARQTHLERLAKFVEFFSDVEAIAKNSGGVTPQDPQIERAFENTNVCRPKSKL